MKLSSFCVASIAVGLWCMAASSAVGGIDEFEFPIDGFQVVPPTGSPGTGFGFVTLDTDGTLTFLLSWNITWGGLLGDETAAHFHGPAPPGMNAGVQVPIGADSPSIGSAFITAAQAADLLDGLWYINIHTTLFPGGEIRGQVVPGRDPDQNLPRFQATRLSSQSPNA